MFFSLCNNSIDSQDSEDYQYSDDWQKSNIIDYLSLNQEDIKIPKISKYTKKVFKKRSEVDPELKKLDKPFIRRRGKKVFKSAKPDKALNKQNPVFLENCSTKSTSSNEYSVTKAPSIPMTRAVKLILNLREGCNTNQMMAYTTLRIANDHHNQSSHRYLDGLDQNLMSITNRLKDVKLNKTKIFKIMSMFKDQKF